MENKYILLIPLLPLLGAAINMLFGRYFGRAFAHTVAVASVFASFVVSLALIIGKLWPQYETWRVATDAGTPAPLPLVFQKVYTWIEVGSLKIDLAFRVDTLSAVMIMVVTGVGTLIHLYSVGYMKGDRRYTTYFAYLNLFTGSMLILVLANNLPVMFIGWEGVGLCSYLLIGFWFEKEANAYAGRKAFIVNRIGDFAFLLGMFLLFWHTGVLDFGGLRADATVAMYYDPLWGMSVGNWAAILLFIGAAGKSAQIPLYVWLPDAMAGPTPVSALIHAATMVTAGVYMVARLGFLYATAHNAMLLVAIIGSLTALFAAIMAFAQNDLKKVLAYSTVSQLGFMFAAAGVGAYTAAIFHLVTHAFFKAGLFLGAGSVMHAMSGSGDITKMGALRKKIPLTAYTFLIYCFAIAGFPFLAGWYSKDEILAGTFAAQTTSWPPFIGEMLWVVLALAALGTAFYMFRLYFLVFEGPETRASAEVKEHIHESPWTMTVPLVVLALLSVFGGLILADAHAFAALTDYTTLGEWLESSTRQDMLGASALGAWALIGIATAIGLTGIAAAWVVYKDGPSPWVERFTTENPLGKVVYDLSYNKFYVDEIYDAAIVRPFKWVARVSFGFFDKFVIDGIFVNGTAKVVDACGRVFRWIQNGQLHRYVGGIVVGAALIVFFTTRGAGHPQIGFQELPNGQVQLVAETDDGPASVGQEITWEIEPQAVDTAALRNNPAPVLPLSKGTYFVTLRFKDGVWEETHEVTRKIDVRGVQPEAHEGEDAGEGEPEADDTLGDEGGAP